MKRVIIIGASYAGLYAAKEFLNNKSYEVIIFDKNKYHYIQVESYGFVANKYDVLDVSINIEDYTKKLNGNISFFNSEITHFDAKEKKVVDSNNNKYSYDYIILATGSLTNFPMQVPNIEKFSTGIKTLKKASEVRQRFESIINKVVYKKSISQKNFNIVIGGAGLSGVEIAAQMADYSYKARKENSNFAKIRIIIVDGMKTVLPNMDERLVKKCHRRLEELDIKIYLGSFIKDVTKEYILLTNNEKIEYDEFIFTGGCKRKNFKFIKNL